MFIHERPNWTNFYWDVDAVAPLIDKVRLAQGHLYGRLEGLGFDVRLREAAEEGTVKIIKNIHQVFAKQSGKISTHIMNLHSLILSFSRMPRIQAGDTFFFPAVKPGRSGEALFRSPLPDW